MAMRLHSSVKTTHIPRGIDPQHFAHIGQKVQIAVDRSQTDVRHAGLDDGVQLIDRGMSVHPAQFLKNDPALIRHSCFGHICSSNALVILK